MKDTKEKAQEIKDMFSKFINNGDYLLECCEKHIESLMMEDIYFSGNMSQGESTVKDRLNYWKKVSEELLKL